VGSLELMLVKQGFTAGEIVHGRLVLKLKEPVEAKRLVVGVEAMQQRTSWTSDGRGGRTRTRETVTVHRFEHPLDGKRLYRDEAFDFHVPLPGNDKPIDLPSGVLGDVARFVGAVAAATQEPVHWRVFGFLDIPWKANLKGHADIVVR